MEHEKDKMLLPVSKELVAQLFGSASDEYLSSTLGKVIPLQIW